MKNSTSLLLFLTFMVLSTTNAQIRNGNLNFKSQKIAYEFNVAKNDAVDFYIIFFENDSSASLQYLSENNCFKKNAGYYLMNISTMRFTDQEKKDLFDEFVKTIERQFKLTEVNLNIVLNVADRSRIPSLRSRNGLHTWETKTIESLCWPVAGETKITTSE